MKKLVWALALALTCAAEGAFAQLEVFTLPEVVVLNDSGRSCAQQIAGDPTESDDLMPTKALFGQIGLRWTGPSNLRLMYMKVSFEGPGVTDNKSVHVYSGQELNFLWNGDARAPNIVSSANMQQSSMNCSFEVGGLGLDDTSQPMTGQGKVFLYGVYDKGGQMVPAMAETVFTFFYDPN
jgi:hypothetical protein